MRRAPLKFTVVERRGRRPLPLQLSACDESMPHLSRPACTLVRISSRLFIVVVARFFVGSVVSPLSDEITPRSDTSRWENTRVHWILHMAEACRFEQRVFLERGAAFCCNYEQTRAHVTQGTDKNAILRFSGPGRFEHPFCVSLFVLLKHTFTVSVVLTTLSMY